jgi:hypothetical protein
MKIPPEKCRSRHGLYATATGFRDRKRPAVCQESAPDVASSSLKRSWCDAAIGRAAEMRTKTMIALVALAFSVCCHAVTEPEGRDGSEVEQQRIRSGLAEILGVPEKSVSNL